MSATRLLRLECDGAVGAEGERDAAMELPQERALHCVRMRCLPCTQLPELLLAHLRFGTSGSSKLSGEAVSSLQD